MAEGTSGGADTVAVDIEDFHDCVSQQSSNSSSASEEEIVFKTEDLNRNWVSSIEGNILLDPELIKSSSASKSCSIHRVPNGLREKNSNAYDPQFISIGPLHYEKRKGVLQAMEEYKWKYLRGIVSRKRQGWLQDCLAAVKGWEKRARNYYSEVIPLDTDSFVEMMLLDGCFILELFRKIWEKDYDVIYRLDWLFQAVASDLVLMENQIPFFVLRRLFALINFSDSSPPLVVHALHFFFEHDSTVLSRIIDSKIKIRHLLHLVHSGYVLSSRKYKKPREIPRIPCATKLKEAGIKFRGMDINESDFLNIKFDEGVIEIPIIQVWDKSDGKFLNLIAFEQCYLHCSSYITTYYHFMDCLVNTTKDVELLSQKGVIHNYLASEELLASHFNSMVIEAIPYRADYYLSDVCEKINAYSKRRWPRFRALLVHDYFNNPWAIISFLAAVALLLFTMTQTFFAAFPKFAAGN